jgi:hypothetical protein
MKPLTTLTLAAASANATDVLRNFPAGQVCQGIILRGTLPCSNGTGAPHAYDAANFVKILDKFLGSLTLKYGPGQNRTVFASVTGSELRTIYRVLNENELLNDVIGTSEPAGAFTAKVSMVLMFDAPLWQSGSPRLPGTTQMRTMKIEIQEGASDTIDADTVRGAGNAIWEVIPITRPGPDQWAPVLSFAKVNSYSYIADAPAGLPLAVWEVTAAYAGTALTKYGLEIGRDVIHDNIAPVHPHSEYLRNFDMGGSNPEDTVTMLYNANKNVRLEDAPSGPVRFTQPVQDLSPIQLRVLYYPARDESEGQEAAVSAAKEWSVPVLASVVSASETDHPGAPAMLPARLIRNDKPEFVMYPGLIGEPSGIVSWSFPDTVVAQAKAVAGMGDRATRVNLGSKLRAKLAGKIPGAIAWDGAVTGRSSAELEAFLAKL